MTDFNPMGTPGMGKSGPFPHFSEFEIAYPEENQRANVLALLDEVTPAKILLHYVKTGDILDMNFPGYAVPYIPTRR